MNYLHNFRNLKIDQTKKDSTFLDETASKLKKDKVMFKKTMLSVLCCVVGFASSTLSCDVIVEKGNRPFNSRLYNELSDVESAHKQLNENIAHFNAFLEEGKKIAKKYNLSDCIGVGLAHKHTVLENNSILIEDRDTSTYGKTALVTRKYEVGMETKNISYFPASWMLGENGYEESEYSTDPEVQEGYQRLTNNSGFLSDFLEITRQYNLEGLLVPVVLPRTWYSSLSEDVVLVEKISHHPFAMIVTGENQQDYSQNDLFQTTWNLGAETTKTRGCLKLKYCVPSWNGGHSGLQTEYHHQL